jgi:RHS repeat-associated protein
VRRIIVPGTSRSWRVTALVAGVLLALSAVTAAAGAPGPAARPGAVPAPPQFDPPVPGVPATAPAPRPDVTGTRAVHGTPAVRWPAPGAADLALTTRLTAAGGLPVRLAKGTAGAGRTTGGAGPAAGPAGPAGMPARARVEVLDRRDAGGPLLRLRRTDGGAATGPVTVELDYSGFRAAYGGDWAGRLRLVRLPDCALTTPSTPDCRVWTPLPGRNDPASGTVTATAAATPTGTLLALAAGPAGSTGDYAATPLAPSASWQVSAQSGDFAWKYPLRLPPAPGNLTPDLTLAYTSGAVDGRVAVTNNQTTWAGEGWDLWPGYVTRRYRACVDDAAGGSPKTGDNCWVTDNATLSFNGRATELVFDAASGWHPRADDGSKVEHLVGAGNGDDDGEFWKVTTVDGTQYFFGSRPEASSAWSVPVFGNQAGEPCHGATFATSWCQQGWRWNLDRVVDRHGNTINYFYNAETNSYGLNLAAATAGYTRGGTLARVEYGTRVGDTGPAPVRVLFDTADRCAPGANCSVHDTASWPDVPWDQSCAGPSCPRSIAPTFWTTRRLAAVTTQVLGSTPNCPADSSGYCGVDRWTFDHTYPAPGDGTSPSLWLHGIVHTGLAGGSAAIPAVTFDGTALPNRVNTPGDGLPPMDKYRLHAISTESGGVISPNYADSGCTPGAPPAPDRNTLRCFPVRWTPEHAGQPLDDWFTKYVVASVVQIDPVGGNPTEVTSYDYLGGAGWAYDDDPLSTADRRTWSRWRGYEQVLVRHGDPADKDNPQSATRYQYFRGLNGDHLADGSTRAVTVTASEGPALPDSPQLAGFLREQITYNGAGGPVVAATINDPWQRGPTATQGSVSAYQVRVGTAATRTALAAGGWRRTETRTGFDDAGLPTEVSDLGDTATGEDDLCTRTSYARNPVSWTLSLPSRVLTLGAACAASPAFPADALSDDRTYYDGGDLGAPPSAGNPTRTEELSDVDGGTARYVTTSRTGYDGYGRVLDSYDALDRRTTTAYQPATGLAVGRTVTNPLNQTVRTALEPAWNQPASIVDPNGRRTDLAYDPLGRLTGVWLPGRSKPAGFGPNLRYGYGLRTDGASWVSTDTLKANGNYVTSYALYDGLLRPRQTQAPGWDLEHGTAGRVLTDTRYDSRGLVAKTNAAYYNDDPPGSSVLIVPDNAVPAQTVTAFDGAERQTTQAVRRFAVNQWQTSTGYGGDHTDSTPPAGGIATTTYTDAQGRPVELRQYPNGPAGSYLSTRYTYTRAGDLESIVDAAGNAWRYRYDLRRRQVRAQDPDTGVRTMSYDAAGQLLTSTDARGATLGYDYDALGRRVAEHQGSRTGPTLAGWVYDTVAVGQLTSATRYAGSAAYTSAVASYDPTGRPLEQSVTIPATEGALAGTYRFSSTYRADGSPDTTTLPALGDLPAETVTSSYDALGLPAATAGAAGYVTATDYTRFAEPARVQLGAVGKRLWQSLYYETGTRRLARVLTQSERTDASTVDDVDYGYDPAGNLTRLGEAAGGTAPADVQCLGYDGLRRLTEAWTATDGCAGAAGSAPGGPAPYWTSYRYTTAGSRLTETRHGLGGAPDTVSTASYPAGQAPAHAPASVTRTGPGSPRTDSYGYDAAGNTTGRGGQTLSWDTEGKLAAVGPADTRVYDAAGGLLIARDAAGATLFLPGGEIRAGTGGRRGTRYYQHGGSTVAVRTAAGVSYLGAADQHGTATLSVDAATLQPALRRFDPFGAPRGTAPASWPDTHGFVGGATAAGTGLTHLGARDYDPLAGRFLSADPLLDPADPEQFDAYGYADANPGTRSDPTGLASGPDGECARFCPYKPGHNPATNDPVDLDWNVHNCQSGNASCRSTGGRHGPAERPRRPRPPERIPLRAGEKLPRNGQRLVVCDDYVSLNSSCYTYYYLYEAGAYVEQSCDRTCVRDRKERGRDAEWKQSWADYYDKYLKGSGFSISFCLGVSIQAGVQAGGEACLSIDSHGIGFSASGKIGFGPAIGFDANASVKLTNADVPNLGGAGTYVGSPGASLGAGKIERGMELSKSDGSPTYSSSIGVGPSFGIGWGPTVGRSWGTSGYFGK